MKKKLLIRLFGSITFSLSPSLVVVVMCEQNQNGIHLRLFMAPALPASSYIPMGHIRKACRVIRNDLGCDEIDRVFLRVISSFESYWNLRFEVVYLENGKTALGS